jgi:tetratricopeptide (TPR) repeat protein
MDVFRNDPIFQNLICILSLTDGHFETAMELYSHAIRLNPHCAVYYGNRSFCSIKLENYGDALTDANKALELDKTYIKVESVDAELSNLSSVSNTILVRPILSRNIQ